jgi:protein-disulfide isomerase
MWNSTRLAAVGFGLALIAVSGPAAAGQEGSTTVAEIGDQKVTLQELQQKESTKLLQASYKYYLAERDALDDLIGNELLKKQASREGISVDELIKRHVSDTLKEPSEEQLHFYYEVMNTDQPYDAVRGKILESLHELRLANARQAYIDSLRSQYGVVIELDEPSAKVNVENAFRLGPQNAPIQLVEFADYECPYCQKVYTDLDALQQHFGAKLSVVFKDFPLPMHPLAEKAAEAARCAGAQGKFWEFHDALFKTKKLQVPDLKQQARTLQLDAARFDECLDSGAQAEAVKNDATEGKHLGLTGTPSFFVNGHFLTGALSYFKLSLVINQELGTLSRTQQSAQLETPKEAAQK